MNEKLTNKMEIAFAVNELKTRFTNWLDELKKRGKRTFPYKEWQSATKEVQDRLDRELMFDREVDRLFFDYNKWCQKTSESKNMRCV